MSRRRHFRTLVSHVDRELRLRTTSAGYEEWFGIPLGQLRGIPLVEVLGRDAYMVMRPHLDSAFAGEYGIARLDVRDCEGEAIAIEATFVPRADASGCVSGVYVVARDLTDEVEAKHRVAVSEARSMALVAALPDQTYELDAEARYLWIQAPDPNELPDSPDRIVGRTIEEVHPPASATLLRQGIERARTTGVVSTVVHVMETIAGTSEVVEVRIAPMETGNFLGIVRSITAQHQAREAMADAASRAEAADRAKSEFLANMSHEIRTPLTAIIGFAGILEKSEELTDASRNAASVVFRNSNHLLELINDILDLSKIEAGQVAVDSVPVAVIDFLEEIEALMLVRADAKGIGFMVAGGDDVPHTVSTDPKRLRQILVNLIGNAIKFTEVGDVRVDVRMVGSGTEAAMAFSVQDSGIGIPAHRLDDIFEPFHQADSASTRDYGGTGLGLAISQRFASLLGGALTVDSEVGVGSRFELTIPVEVRVDATADGDTSEGSDLPPTSPRADSAGAGVGETQRLVGLRVLLVEDGPDNQALFSLHLGHQGAEVAVSENGALGLEEALAEFEAGRPFDVILMDMQMPVMDGYTATAKLREAGYQGPIVALTAHANEDERDRCLRAGCDDFANKPITPERLCQLVLDNLAGSPPGPLAATKPGL